MTSRYAKATTVPVERSKAEIERTLTRYGATKFAYMTQLDAAMIGFTVHGRQIRFILPLPDKNDMVFWRTPKRLYDRTLVEAEKAWEQACRQRWRSLALAVKSKLETVEAGIATFEQEFLSYTLLPDGQTAGEWLLPQVEEAYRLNLMPEMLPMLSGGQEPKMLREGNHVNQD
ncbi:hypothetical protein LCGC14_1491970 [marine sediment metagenome]|uniref:Uncharacterized protein n=1 Tax=marine sediment metagenome TaxID=412755 RepID=A0A0F9LLY9_9ZZZZ